MQAKVALFLVGVSCMAIGCGTHVHAVDKSISQLPNEVSSLARKVSSDVTDREGEIKELVLVVEGGQGLLRVHEINDFVIEHNSRKTVRLKAVFRQPTTELTSAVIVAVRKKIGSGEAISSLSRYVLAGGEWIESFNQPIERR